MDNIEKKTLISSGLSTLNNFSPQTSNRKLETSKHGLGTAEPKETRN